MAEENEEYLEAAQKGDLVEVADALGDMLYILCGTILKHGLQDKIEEVFQEIQRSNMSKLDENGKPIYREDGKVLKSLRELFDALAVMDYTIYYSHANPSKNDFANWVEGVFKLHDLASEMRKASSSRELSQIISEFLKWR